MGYREIGKPLQMKLIKVFEEGKLVKEYANATITYCEEVGYGTSWNGFAIVDDKGCYDIYKKPKCSYKAIA